jgi:hypothetical protein
MALERSEIMMFTGEIESKNKLNLTQKSFIAIITSAVVMAIVYCFSSGISGNDFWWHIKLGEWVWEYKQIPTNDVFSWYGAEIGLKCTVQEWLGDVILFGIHKLAGDVGVFIMALIAALLFIFMSLKMNLQKMFNNAVFSAIFFALFAVLSTLFFYGRPHIFSFYLFFAEIYCLYRFNNNPESKVIWFVPIIGCLWSNLHGGSSNLSYLLCIIFLVCGLIKVNIGKLTSERMDNKQIRTILFITGLTIVSVLLNPIGLDIFIYPYVNMGNNFMLAVISEWAAPDAKDISNLILYFVPLFMVVISLIVTDKKIKLIDLALILIFALLFFRSIRFIMFFYIISSFTAFDYFPKWRLQEIKGKFEKVSAALFLCLIVVGIVLSVVHVVPLAQDNKLISKAVDDDIITVIKKNNPKRLFNDYNYGETLIYNDIPVFFDSRADLYANDNILKDGIQLMHLQSADGEGSLDIDGLLCKYEFDGFFIAKVRPLYVYLLSHPEKYSLVYSNESSGYFAVNKF